MYIWLILALIFAILEFMAVSKNIRHLEYIAKPAVMVFLFLWLYTATALQGNALWFGLGLLFSLAGDVLLLFPFERYFLRGLAAFLMAHIFYIAGFRDALMNFSGWSLILLFIIAVNSSRLLRRFLGAMRARGQNTLVLPVVVYGIVISLMLYAAMSTIYDQTWNTRAVLLVGVGALLFVISDAILAWIRFIAPLKNGRVWVMTLYHLGQIGLIAGAISQFR